MGTLHSLLEREKINPSFSWLIYDSPFLIYQMVPQFFLQLAQKSLSGRLMVCPHPLIFGGFMRKYLSPSWIANAVHKYLICYVGVFFQDILKHYNHHTMFWIPKTKNFYSSLHPIPGILLQLINGKDKGWLRQRLERRVLNLANCK